MARPDSVAGLFNGSIPDDWETVADFERFYVGGLRDALRDNGLRTKVDTLSPVISEIPDRVKQAGWDREFPSEHWGELKKNAVDRACRKSLLNFPKAAMVVMAADMTIVGRNKEFDAYNHIWVVPATSYISGLTFEIFEDFLRRLAEQTGKNAKRYLKRNLTQVNDDVFHDMVRGKTVTNKLASDLLTIISDIMPEFGGVVSDDFQARIRSIRDLREQDRMALGDERKPRYTKKISASSAEVFWG